MDWTSLYGHRGIVHPETITRDGVMVSAELRSEFLPVLVAEVFDSNHWSVRCPYCGRPNVHSSMVGYRHAHCRCEGQMEPGRMEGYVIAPPGAKWAPYVDCCPHCGVRGGPFTPVDLEPAERSVKAHYVCDESHGWVCNWGDLPDGPMRGRAAVPAGRRRCALYRHYDAAGALLYVGITENPEGRLREHSRSSIWVEHAHHMTAEWFDSRDAAEAAERTAIRSEVPIFNIAHALGDPDARIRAYLSEASK